MNRQIQGHYIESSAVIKRHPHIGFLGPVRYMLVDENNRRSDNRDYFSVNDISLLLSDQQRRSLLSEVASVMPFDAPVEITTPSSTKQPDKNYEIKFQFCSYKTGDVVTESELVAKMNMMNKPIDGPQPMSYYKSKFPSLVGEILVETNKPRRINF